MAPEPTQASGKSVQAAVEETQIHVDAATGLTVVAASLDFPTRALGVCDLFPSSVAVKSRSRPA